NKFLTDLNEADVLVHIVDFSGKTDEEGEPTEGHDPRQDIDFLEEEMDMWYLEILEKGIRRYENRNRQPDVKLEEELAEQMSAFKISKNRIKQLILSLDLELD
ncbi:MAG: GTPase, partial [Candidatus Nanohaloarchaea archaeon]